MRRLRIEGMCSAAGPEHMLRPMYSWPCRKKVSCLPLLGRPHDPVVTTYALGMTRHW